MEQLPVQHKEFLFLLVLPVALALWTLLKPGAPVNAPVAEGVLVRQPVTAALLKAGLLLPSVLLALFIILLARPVVQQQVTSRNPVQATNIEILLNASRSMLAEAEIGEHCRYCASKKAIGKFVEKRNGNTMGISIFGSDHVDLVPLTLDLNCVVQSIDETYPDWISPKLAHRKDFAKALTASIGKLSRKTQMSSEQILILVTDGENRDLAQHEGELRKRLAESNITLYVALIADGGNARTLARLAEGTKGGKLFECKDAMGFAEIMRHIDRMNRIVYQDAEPRMVDNNWPFLLAVSVVTALFACYLTTPFRPTPW